MKPTWILISGDFRDQGSLYRLRILHTIVVSPFDCNAITFNIKYDHITDCIIKYDHTWSIWGESVTIQLKKSSENIIMINITFFCEWQMSNWVPLHEKTEFKDDRCDSLVCIVSFCDWSTSLDFSSISSIFEMGKFIWPVIARTHVFMWMSCGNAWRTVCMTVTPSQN